MIRKLILGLVLLAIAAVPVPVLAREHGREGRHEFRGGHERFERHERFEHFRRPFVGIYPSPYYAYAPSCGWQGGYWVNQPYVDAYGRYSYVPQWVPAQWVCD